MSSWSAVRYVNLEKNVSINWNVRFQYKFPVHDENRQTIEIYVSSIETVLVKKPKQKKPPGENTRLNQSKG